MKNNVVKRIGVFTSGGDSPGMNAAIRAVVRAGTHCDLHIYGIHEGYKGMIEGNIHRLESRDVGHIIHQGGTILRTARSKMFLTPEGRKSAYESLKAHNIDACIAIGGNGTFAGANVFSSEYHVPMIGLPGTIDNDIYGTDYSIGFDTAVNTAVEAIDKIRDTAISHNRIFFIEVMGRHSGYIALHSGIASGATAIFLPEVEGNIEHLKKELRLAEKRGKMFNLVIVAEGDEQGNAHHLAKAIKEDIEGRDVRVAIIGHLQRGGSPTAKDRILASRLGYAAVQGLVEGKENIAIGIQGGKLSYTPFSEAINKPNPLDEELRTMVNILSL